MGGERKKEKRASSRPLKPPTPTPGLNASPSAPELHSNHKAPDSVRVHRASDAASTQQKLGSASSLPGLPRIGANAEAIAKNRKSMRDLYTKRCDGLPSIRPAQQPPSHWRAGGGAIKARKQLDGALIHPHGDDFCAYKGAQNLFEQYYDI